MYFEVPFYLFLIVPMSLLFSWKLAYLNVCEYISHDEAVDEQQPPNRRSSAESLDHGESPRASITEPLLQSRQTVDYAE